MTCSSRHQSNIYLQGTLINSKYTIMRIIQRNVLESIGAAVPSGIRLWKATAPTALHSDYAPERPERRSRMWAAGSRESGSSELGIPPEISIYSDLGWDSSEPNVRLERSV